jgi:hypothetical protein
MPITYADHAPAREQESILRHSYQEGWRDRPCETPATLRHALYCALHTVPSPAGVQRPKDEREATSSLPKGSLFFGPAPARVDGRLQGLDDEMFSTISYVFHCAFRFHG